MVRKLYFKTNQKEKPVFEEGKTVIAFRLKDGTYELQGTYFTQENCRRLTERSQRVFSDREFVVYEGDNREEVDARIMMDYPDVDVLMLFYLGNGAYQRKVLPKPVSAMLNSVKAFYYNGEFCFAINRRPPEWQSIYEMRSVPYRYLYTLGSELCHDASKKRRIKELPSLDREDFYYRATNQLLLCKKPFLLFKNEYGRKKAIEAVLWGKKNSGIEITRGMRREVFPCGRFWTELWRKPLLSSEYNMKVIREMTPAMGCDYEEIKGAKDNIQIYWDNLMKARKEMLRKNGPAKDWLTEKLEIAARKSSARAILAMMDAPPEFLEEENFDEEDNGNDYLDCLQEDFSIKQEGKIPFVPKGAIILDTISKHLHDNEGRAEKEAEEKKKDSEKWNVFKEMVMEYIPSKDKHRKGRNSVVQNRMTPIFWQEDLLHAFHSASDSLKSSALPDNEL